MNEKLSTSNLLAKVVGKPTFISASPFTGRSTITKPDAELLRKAGITSGQLGDVLRDQLVVNFDRHSIYTECDRAQCFTGDTRVYLLDGTNPTIKEMADEPDKYVGKYTLSVNTFNLQLEPDKIVACMKTGVGVEVIEVELDNGEKVRCTPEHRFMLRDGTYREAQHLQPNDSLMPLYLRDSSSFKKLDGYYRVYKTNSRASDYTYVHRLVGSYMAGHPLSNKHTVHHKNFNKKDNDPSNLIVMSSEEHKKYHKQLVKFGTFEERYGLERASEIGKKISRTLMGRVPWNKGLTKETNAILARIANKNLGQDVSVETREKLRKASTGRVKSLEERAKLSKAMTGKKYIRSDEFKRELSKMAKATWQKVEYREKMIEHLNKIRPLSTKVLLNHKVAVVRKLDIKEDVYDITTERNHNFPLSIGVFVHNSHWLMGGALELYADVASTYSRIQNATIWITAEDPKYQRILTDLISHLNLEERIFDWAWTTGCYGDLFVEVNMQPGFGVISVDDTFHPIAVSRADYNGRLIGFFETPLGYTSEARNLQAPWKFVHFRLLGAKKRRPMFGDPTYAEYRTINIMAPDTRRLSSNYGTSLYTNALPVYKRLRMSEDCLLMARASKGVLRYLYKLKVDGCFRGNTSVKLLDGTSPTIKEISENKDKFIGKDIWTINPATLQVEVSKIKDAWKTHDSAPLVRVHLDNKSSVDCTPEHRFMLRDGTYKEARYLQPNDSLMPLYEIYSKKYGYTRVYNPSTSKWVYAHKKVFNSIPSGSVVHHKDFHPMNNDRSNLQLMTIEEHINIHKIDGVWKKKIGDSVKLAYKNGKYQDRFFRKHTSKTLKKISLSLKKAVVEGRMRTDYRKGMVVVPRLEVECECGCGRKFEIRVTQKRKFFNRECYKRWSVKIYGGKGIERFYKDRQTVLNHKVAYVEFLKETDSVYDIQVDSGNANFPLANGVFVHNSNNEAVSSVIEEVSTILKRARALDTSAGSPNFEENDNSFSVMEDIVMPVWGDARNDLVVEKLGGEADIRWITDIEELRNQCASALRVPVQMLGGYVGEMPSNLGRNAMENLDIRFARSARRLQRALINGITRLCQLHLAGLNMNPSVNLFKVNMSETSTAEELEIMDGLDRGVDVVDKMVDLFDKYGGENFNRLELLDYLNSKVLKLNDLDIDRIMRSATGTKEQFKESIKEAVENRSKLCELHRFGENSDFSALLPTTEGEATWTTNYGDCKIKCDVVNLRGKKK